MNRPPCKRAAPTARRILHAAAAIAALSSTRLAAGAYVEASQFDEASDGRRQVAAVTFSSVSKAAQAISEGLTGIGADGAEESAQAVLSWLTMLPALDCADTKRETTVVLISPQDGQEMPDQAATVPLKPVYGEGLLRDSLAAAYGRISGEDVLMCSEPRDDRLMPSLAVIVTHDTAFVANDRRSLKWIAARRQSGTLPSAGHLRDGAAISASFDARLSGETVSRLVSGDIADQARDVARLLVWFRDLLAGLDALHVSLSADLHSWRLAVQLNPREGGASLSGARPPSGKTLADIPRSAYCVSSGDFRRFASMLPGSFTSAFSGATSYSFFSGFGIFPGPVMSERAEALAPFLSGESSSAYAISRSESLAARVSSHALSDPAGAAKALEGIFAGQIDKSIAIIRTPRVIDGHRIYSYTSVWQPSPEVANDYLASVLVLLAELNCVEAAIDGDRLLVVSGRYGTIDRLLRRGSVSGKERTPESLAMALGPLPEGEALVASGESQPSQALRAFIEYADNVGDLARRMPRHGGSFFWRVSRKGDGAVFEISLSNTELFAISRIRQLEQQQIGRILLDRIIRSAGAQ